VFQAVHMLLEGDFHTAWPPGPRQSRIVLIGRNLDEPALAAGFAACAAP
jgi:G3E family GTPase